MHNNLKSENLEELGESYSDDGGLIKHNLTKATKNCSNFFSGDSEMKH